MFTFSMEFSFNFDLSFNLQRERIISNLDYFPFCFALPLLEIFHFWVRCLALDHLLRQRKQCGVQGKGMKEQVVLYYLWLTGYPHQVFVQGVLSNIWSSKPQLVIHSVPMPLTFSVIHRNLLEDLSMPGADGLNNKEFRDLTIFGSKLG